MQKKPWTALTFLLMIVMIAGSMGWGAVKHWSVERDNINTQLAALSNQLVKKVEIASNILTVASRHLSADSAIISTLSADIKVLKGNAGLSEKVKADLLFTKHMKDALSALEATDAGMETNFDYGYIKQRFPYDLENIQEDTIETYRASVDQYNSGLTGSLSGSLARVFGISPIGNAILVGSGIVLQEGFDKGNAVNIPSGLLSADTLNDIKSLNEQLKNTGFHFVLAAQNFLGGQNIQAYAEELFTELSLDEKSIMLFMAIGEQRYFPVTGAEVKKKLRDDDVAMYLAKYLHTPFMNQQYDLAIGGFLLAAGSQIAENSNIKLDKAGLFGTQTVQTTPATGWWNDFFLGSASNMQNTNTASTAEIKGNLIGFPTIFIIGIILYMIFGRKHGNRRPHGCGCGPLGWIFGAFGLADLFGLRKR
jgi:hypothetical protein